MKSTDESDRIAQLEALVKEQGAQLAELAARPMSPHAKAIEEFDSDFARRVEAGKVAEAAAHKRQLEWESQNPPAHYVRLTVVDKSIRDSLEWHEVDVEAGTSRYKPSRGANGQVGEWLPGDDAQVQRTHSLSKLGEHVCTADELAERITRSAAAAKPTLADRIESGALAVYDFTDAENLEHERLMRKRAGSNLHARTAGGHDLGPTPSVR